VKTRARRGQLKKPRPRLFELSNSDGFQITSPTHKRGAWLPTTVSTSLYA
jgi:hypothetical protein